MIHLCTPASHDSLQYTSDGGECDGFIIPILLTRWQWQCNGNRRISLTLLYPVRNSIRKVLLVLYDFITIAIAFAIPATPPPPLPPRHDSFKHTTCIPRWNNAETTVSTSFQCEIHVVCLQGYIWELCHGSQNSLYFGNVIMKFKKYTKVWDIWNCKMMHVNDIINSHFNHAHENRMNSNIDE